jgi:hypothetical protein
MQLKLFPENMLVLELINLPIFWLYNCTVHCEIINLCLKVGAKSISVKHGVILAV